MKTCMISFVALALLASGCIGEHGSEQGDEENYRADDEQLMGEDPARVEATSVANSPGVPGGPPRHILKGTRSIVCAGIQWQNMASPAAGPATCQNLSEHL